MPEVKRVTIINRGERTYITASGKLLPGKSLSVSEDEARVLLDNADLMDASKVVKVPPSKLQKELDETREHLAKTRDELKAALTRVKDLEEELAARKDSKGGK